MIALTVAAVGDLGSRGPARKTSARGIMDLSWYGYGANTMSKERNATKEGKKKPTMTPKERKALKRAKKEARKSLHS
jgi:hypothetical protein